MTAMRQPICWSLACALLASQFIGCASVPQPTRPAVIRDNEPWAITPVTDGKANDQSFRDKLAELKGNILKFHAADTAYAQLSRSIDQLDHEQNITGSNNVRIRNKSALIGAPVGAALIVVWLAATATRPNNSYGPSNGAALAIGLPSGAAVGALAGLLISGAVTGPDVVPQQVRRLNELILQYNETLNATKVRDSGAIKN